MSNSGLLFLLIKLFVLVALGCSEKSDFDFETELFVLEFKKDDLELVLSSFSSLLTVSSEEKVEKNAEIKVPI